LPCTSTPRGRRVGVRPFAGDERLRTEAGAQGVEALRPHLDLGTDGRERQEVGPHDGEAAIAVRQGLGALRLAVSLAGEIDLKLARPGLAGGVEAPGPDVGIARLALVHPGDEDVAGPRVQSQSWRSARPGDHLVGRRRAADRPGLAVEVLEQDERAPRRRGPPDDLEIAGAVIGEVRLQQKLAGRVVGQADAVQRLGGGVETAKPDAVGGGVDDREIAVAPVDGDARQVLPRQPARRNGRIVHPHLARERRARGVEPADEQPARLVHPERHEVARRVAHHRRMELIGSRISIDLEIRAQRLHGQGSLSRQGADRTQQDEENLLEGPAKSAGKHGEPPMMFGLMLM
jgi:hypothetical protein